MTEKTFYVFGNHGSLKVSYTGEVLEVSDNPHSDDSYAGIIHFDVEEWKRAYPDEELCDMDILDIGFWDSDGRYEGPEEDWREEFRDDLKTGKVGEFR